MGKKKLDVMAKGREVFINGQVDESGNVVVPGCVRNGIDEKSANKIFDEMAEFAKYAFNKSHAAAYAVISYRTAYLKAYYKEELMAATLNSFLGNLDKIPLYIYDCREMGIEILKPDINKSYTKFTVQDGKIRFGLGSIKNVGTAVIDALVNDREKNGAFERFTSFCERVKNLGVNKKCIESLIKAGAFDEFGKNRATLLASYEGILDTINNENKNKMANQVSMFEFMNDDETQIETQKYNIIEKEEMEPKELLGYEKEMLGVYISGHPLDKIKDIIEKNTNINTLIMHKIDEDIEEKGLSKDYKDGTYVKFAGIISKVSKKFTRKNTVMAFLTVEDYYGMTEIIVFDSLYERISNLLIEDNTIFVEGRLSIREDEPVKIVANTISEFNEKSFNNKSSNFIDNLNNYNNFNSINKININISDLSDEQKTRLRGAIKFFSGDRANTKLEITDKGEVKPCRAIYTDEKIINVFKDIVGAENLHFGNN